MRFISTNGFYFSRDCDNKQREEINVTQHRNKHRSRGFLDQWLTKKRAPDPSDVVARTESGLFLTEEYSRFYPVILLSNSKQFWQFQQNRLRKFGHGSLTTALLQIQLNTPVNFTVSGSQQRPPHLFTECLCSLIKPCSAH